MNSLTATRTSLRDFLHIIFKWKNWILIFFGLMVLSVGVISLLVKPTFKATSQLLVKIGRENLYLPSVPRNDRLAVSVGVDREEYINSEIQILKSRSLAEEVLIAMGPSAIEDVVREGEISLLNEIPRHANAGVIPMEKAVAGLLKSLDVERVRKSNVIQVSFKHHDPQLAAETVNMVCEQYLERHLNVHQNSQSLIFFQAQSEILEKQLDATENKLRRFKAKHRISSLSEERSLLLAKTNELKASLNHTVSLEAETKRRIDHLSQQLESTPQTILHGKEVDHNPYILSNLQSKLVELELEKEELLTKYTPSSRFVQNIEDEIRLVNAKLEAQESKRFGKSIYRLNTNHQRIQDTLLNNQVEVQALRVRRITQASQIETYRKRIKSMNRVEAELARLQQKMESDRQNYQLYLSKLEESRISNAMDKEKMVSVNLVESAKPPVKPLFPNIPLNILLAVMAGFFGGLSIALLAEYFDDSFEQTEDLEQFLKVPVLGNIPCMEQKQKGTSANVS